MKVRIHRGANEVGGSCVEVEAGDCRIVLDVGRPLDALRDDVIRRPVIAGFDAPDESLLALIISYGHQDRVHKRSDSSSVPMSTSLAHTQLVLIRQLGAGIRR
jgi:predicted metal-dependent RNase